MLILGFKVLRVEDWVNTDADSFDSKKQNALKRQQDWKHLIMWSHCPARVDQRRTIALTLDDVFATWTEFIIDQGKE